MSERIWPIDRIDRIRMDLQEAAHLLHRASLDGVPLDLRNCCIELVMQQLLETMLDVHNEVAVGIVTHNLGVVAKL